MCACIHYINVRTRCALRPSIFFVTKNRYVLAPPSPGGFTYRKIRQTVLSGTGQTLSSSSSSSAGPVTVFATYVTDAGTRDGNPRVTLSIYTYCKTHIIRREKIIIISVRVITNEIAGVRFYLFDGARARASENTRREPASFRPPFFF